MLRRARVPGTIVFSTAITLLASGTVQGGALGTREPESSPSLREVVESYLHADDSKERSQIASSILRATDGDIGRVARELPGLRLWSDQPQGGLWTIGLPSGETVELTFRLPPGYKPDRAIPLLFLMRKQAETPESAFDAVRSALGDSGDEYAIVTPDKAVGGSFHQSAAHAGDLPALLKEIRKRIHIDSDRLTLFGRGAGGDAAWMAAIMYPTEFAGVIVVSAFPRIPFPEQAYALLLGNLGQLPVLTIWYTPVSAATSPPPTNDPIAAFNRAIVDYAKRTSLPIVGVDLPGAANAPGLLPRTETTMVLGGRRSRVRPGIQHWFRYPGQGDCGWLRATEFAGDVWQYDQLSIAPAPGTDRDRFITDTIVEKLAFLSGRIEGQNITVETRRCGGVELRLSPEHVDFEKPITIVCNGRKRFEGPIRPSITDLLESASENWDFQHPVFWRKRFEIRTDSSVDVP